MNKCCTLHDDCYGDYNQTQHICDAMFCKCISKVPSKETMMVLQFKFCKMITEGSCQLAKTFGKYRKC